MLVAVAEQVVVRCWKRGRSPQKQAGSIVRLLLQGRSRICGDFGGPIKMSALVSLASSLELSYGVWILACDSAVLCDQITFLGSVHVGRE